LTQITHEAFDRVPRWSPDGSLIAFADQSHDVGVNYSPNRRHIVFASDRMNSNSELETFTMNSDGTGMKRIATGITIGGAPMVIASARPGGGHLTSPTRRGFASEGRRHPRPSAKPLTTWICISERILSALGRGPKRERISIRSI
jgi:hypothetical protein